MAGNRGGIGVLMVGLLVDGMDLENSSMRSGKEGFCGREGGGIELVERGRVEEVCWMVEGI